MATIADEINAISVDHGYTGPAPKTIADAIDALADTLAGTDVEGKRTIADAVEALAPYIGSGGGGAALGAGYELVVTGADYDIIASDQPMQPMTLGEQGPEGMKLFMPCRAQTAGSIIDMNPMMPAGMHVLLAAIDQTSRPTYTVQGVEYESVNNGYAIQFVMPENAVSVNVNGSGGPL